MYSITCNLRVLLKPTQQPLNLCIFHIYNLVTYQPSGPLGSPRGSAPDYLILEVDKTFQISIPFEYYVQSLVEKQVRYSDASQNCEYQQFLESSMYDDSSAISNPLIILFLSIRVWLSLLHNLSTHCLFERFFIIVHIISEVLTKKL